MAANPTISGTIFASKSQPIASNISVANRPSRNNGNKERGSGDTPDSRQDADGQPHADTREQQEQPMGLDDQKKCGARRM
jgi:hypothetical protein